MSSEMPASHQLKFLGQIPLSQVMVTPVVSIEQNEELSRAEELFVKHKVFYLPVVTQEKKLVGMITHKYLYKTQSPRKILNEDMRMNPDIVIDGHSYYDKDILDSYILKSVMYKNPCMLAPDDSLGLAMKQMATLKVGCVSVVKPDQTLVGILTVQDVIRYLAQFI